MKMSYSPWSGNLLFDGRDHEEFRKAYPSHQWLHNPWTGAARDPRDVESDPTGILILPPGESLLAAASPLAQQEGGGHYKAMKIQVVEYVHANGIGYFEGNVIKYVSRWRAKGGLEDLKKARHYIDLLLELESKK